MADDVIGSVKVRVRPDTSTFAKETEDGVDKAVDRVNRKARTSKDLMVQLHSTLDTKNLMADTRQALREVNAELKTNDKLKVQFRAAISRVGMKKEVNEAHKALQAFADAKKAIDFKATLDGKEMKSVVQQIKALGDEIGEELDDAGSLKFRIDEDSLVDVRGGIRHVEAALADLKRIDVKVDLDEDSLLDELDRLRGLEHTLPMKLKVDEASVASLKAAISAIDAELTRQAEVEIEVNLDEDSLLAARANYMAQVELMEAQQRSLAEAQKKAAKEAADAAKKAAQEAKDSAENFARMGKNVGTVIARLTGLRLVYGIFSHFGDFFKNLDKNLPLIGTLALAMAGLGGMALDAAGGIFALSRALAQIGPGAVALPGILGGIAIGLGSWVFLLKDINKAMPGLKAQFTELGDAMRTAFWTDATKSSIQTMVDTLLPILQRNLVKTSTALAGFTQALAGSFTQKFDGKVLDTMFLGLNRSIKIFTGYTDSIAQIFRILGTAGAGQLPALAEWFGKLTERFANFLRQSEKSGAITGWIETAKARLSSLWDVLVHGWNILTGLATAADNASKGDALSNLADSLQRVSDVVNGSNFQTKLTAVLMAADEMMANISAGSGAQFMAFWDTFSVTLTQILPKAGEAIGTLAGAIYDMLGSTPVQNGLVALFDGLAAGAAALAPAFEVLGPKMGATMQLLGVAFEQIGGIMASVITAVAPVAQAIMETLTPVIEKVGPLVKQVFQDLGPVFAAVAEHVSKMQGPLLSLVGSFQGLWNVVGPILIPVLTTLIGILGGAVRGVISGIALAFQGVTQVITGVVNVFKGLGNIFMGVVEALTGGGLSRLKTGFSQVFGGLKDIVVGALKAVAGALWAWLNGSLLAFVRGGLVKLLGIWKGGWSGLLNAAKSVWNAIKGGATSFIGGVKGLITRGVNAIKTAWTQVWNAIKSILGPIWGAIKGTVSAAIGTVRGVITTGVNAIKAFWQGGWAGVKSVLSNAWSSMVSKVKEMAGKVLSEAKAIPGKVKSALGSLGSTLKASGMALIQGFIDGMSEKIGAAVDKAKSLMSQVRDYFPFSPAKKGAFSGKGYTTYSGRALVGDFAKGMLDAAPIAAKAASDTAEAVKEAQEKADKKTARAAIKRWKKLGADLVKGTQQGLIQNLPGMNSLVQQIVKDIPDKVSKKVEKKLRSQAASMQQKIDTLTDVMGQIESKLQEVKDAADDFASTAVSAMTDLGNPASLGALELETPEISFDDIIANYDAAIQRATDFSAVVNQLRSMGLDNDVLQQIIEAGPEAGYAAAKAIADSGAEGVAQVNALSGHLESAAGGIKDTAYQTMYETGMQAAQGIIQGLRDQRDALVTEIQDLAEAMRKAMKKALKIKSPSRVFRELGGHTGEGFVLGIRDKHEAAEKAITELSSPRPSAPNVSRAVMTSGSSTQVSRTINYYAAAGSNSISGEEALFAALTRARSNGF